MSTVRRIPINNDLDIVVARLQAREVARELGFSTVDQARISLAAGDLARVLAQTVQGRGEIVISGANTYGHVGIQVISVNPNVASEQPPTTDKTHQANGESPEISNALSLVDEYLVEDQGNDGTRVTLMKWLT
jgi:serine/threonine-protein kinase RsbT